MTNKTRTAFEEVFKSEVAALVALRKQNAKYEERIKNEHGYTLSYDTRESNLAQINELLTKVNNYEERGMPWLEYCA